MVRFFWHVSTVYLALLSIVCCNTIVPEGFVADTLVRVPVGYAYIQNLCVGDEIFVCTWFSKESYFNDGNASDAITHITSHEVESIIRIQVGGAILELAEDQLLFVPLQQRWLPASQIHEGMYLLGVPLRAVHVKSVERIDQRTQVYAISLSEHHNYLVGEHDIVVHNFGEVVFAATEAAGGITFLNAFLAANPLVAPITITVGGVGLV